MASRLHPGLAFVTDTLLLLLAYRFPLCFVSFHLFEPCSSLSTWQLLFSTYKVLFDRPRSIKEGQISLYRLATSILESVFNGTEPRHRGRRRCRRRSGVFRVSFSNHSTLPPVCCFDCYWFYDYHERSRVPCVLDFRKRRTIAIKSAFLAAFSRG